MIAGKSSFLSSDRIFRDSQEFTITEEGRFLKELGHPPSSGFGAKACGWGPCRDSARPGPTTPQGRERPGQWMLPVLLSSGRDVGAPRDRYWGGQSFKYK